MLSLSAVDTRRACSRCCGWWSAVLSWGERPCAAAVDPGKVRTGGAAHTIRRDHGGRRLVADDLRVARRSLECRSDPGAERAPLMQALFVERMSGDRSSPQPDFGKLACERAGTVHPRGLLPVVNWCVSCFIHRRMKARASCHFHMKVPICQTRDG